MKLASSAKGGPPPNWSPGNFYPKPIYTQPSSPSFLVFVSESEFFSTLLSGYQIFGEALRGVSKGCVSEEFKISPTGTPRTAHGKLFLERPHADRK